MGGWQGIAIRRREQAAGPARPMGPATTGPDRPGDPGQPPSGAPAIAAFTANGPRRWTAIRLVAPTSGRASWPSPPGKRLAPRDTDFSVRRLRRGGPADSWQLPGNLHSRLQARYHQLASRELALGRHRRAAYIYAELLGNLALAASALKSGGHWREAAVLYREQLHRPDEAASCLEQGNLWTEAIAIYEELGHFEKAGDLYTRLDQLDSAHAVYRKAVNQHLARKDRIAAALVLSARLANDDGAIDCLEAGWPSSMQAAECLEELFQFLGRRAGTKRHW